LSTDDVDRWLEKEAEQLSTRSLEALRSIL
jgi:hypothetical protein